MPVKSFKRSKKLSGLWECRLGNGSIIYMVDNPLFRSFWENGKLFFVNAVFFTNNHKFRI
ncbi:hypothetical protein [Aquimarina hainanensis]|uniref:hypothetical protein n=1 Tax=Aquimarina hainanensis TaxID=1578017 RepID=UPI0036082A35